MRRVPRALAGWSMTDLLPELAELPAARSNE
jgi:hypothetical protein